MSDTAEKYRDKVDEGHEMAMAAIGLMRAVLSPHRERLEALLKAESNMHDFGCMFDPTLYRDMIYSKSFAQQIRMVKAALAFLDVVDAVAAELGAPSP